MKKIVVGLSISLVSSSVFAIENGTTVDWQNDFDDMVKNNCTGLVIGGNQVLTAAHCTDLTSITFANGDVVNASGRVDHPSYLWSGSGSQYDVSVWTLPEAANTKNIHYFADLNVQNVNLGDDIRVYGFGGNYPLSYAVVSIDRLSSSWHTAHQGNVVVGNTIQGDSGGAWFHNNEVIGVHRGSGGSLTSGTDLHYAKDFLLEQINGWHYPTVLKGTGTQTVKVQSLHQNSVVDSATSSGDVTITGGTCQTLPAIDAFDTCTYELDVSGSGQLHLTTNEVIDINPVTPTPVPPPTTTPSSGGSGGSLGVFSLLGLAVFGRLRKRQV
ncbi:trypsin-like serine protease [Vibrio sp. 10N.261.51.A1]|uniref:Serine protease n=2 Tax=Vibrio cyclitrophicus TaxID=47951 RepID=A0A7Z1S1U6_9VIBR|nr:MULTISPECIES: trypsin-like serine protease [Vibrio]PMK83210.1 trypsin [Vibrio sp. 10N.261.52.E5]PMP19902.1 trypsin [Vibrio cyclitrophicus]PMP28033.1 trypsin [Vibrio cyclitrophicus]TKF79571.1 S1 family peptidase [Vibrio sp. F13]